MKDAIVIPPAISWDECNTLYRKHLASFREKNSGMHTALLATTRSGKTTLAIGNQRSPGLLSHFEHALVLDTTGDPGPLKDYGKPLSRFGNLRGHERLTVNDMGTKSREKIYRAIQRAIRQGHCAIYADELRQLLDKKFFGLAPVFDHLWLFTAKRGVSLIAGSQAPRWLSSAFYEQSKVHFIFGMRDRRAMKRLAEISGDVDTLEETIPKLAEHEFAYVGLDGSVIRSMFDLKPEPKAPRKQSPVTGLTVVRS